MTRASRLAALILCSAVAAAADDFRFGVTMTDGTVTRTEGLTRPRGVIVELAAPRASMSASGARAARAAVLAQLRADLAAIPAAKIEHEYSIVFFGVAVDAFPAALAAIRALDYVVAIHPDRPVRAYANGEAIDARPRVNAQGMGVRGAGTVVSVIDTGIDYNHPALGGGFGPGFKVAGGYDFVNDDGDPMDDAGHGTHVAGTVAANAADLIGVAPDARLLAYKVLDASGSGYTSDIIAGIERSVDPNGDGDLSDAADVINLSLGGGGTADDPMARAVDRAVAAGVVVCVAAGNAGETASIGTPGAAADAITVGAVDGAGVLATFSSRGPTSKLLTFKPEITAPGVGIVSARAGGGFVAANGTSMATPHVAGVAALLRELHPDWTPARIKAAIVGGAVSVSGGPFARGAGRIDAARADRASLLLSEAGVSFGLSHDGTATEVRTRSVTVANVGTTAETFSWNPSTTAPTGIDVTPEPASVALAPGASATIVLRLTIDPALRPFADDVTAGGDVTFNGARGTSSFSIPWALLRGARATVTYDALSTGLVAFAPNASRRPSQYGEGAFEMFVKPGASWEFVLTGVDVDEEAEAPSAIRYLIAEKRQVDGDVLVPFAAADASVRLTFAATDSDGRLLRDLPEEGDAQRRYVTTRLNFLDGEWRLNSLIQARGIRDVYLSPVSDRYTLIPFEAYIDALAMRGYNVQHRVFRGASASESLTAGPADYLHATLRWERPAGPRELFLACTGDANTTSAFFSFAVGGCAGAETAGPIAFEYYTTAETTEDAFSGFLFQDGFTRTATFRGRDGHLVASSEAIPPRTAPAILDGGEVSIGGGLYFPFAFYGTTAGLPVFWPAPAFIGPFGETLRSDTVPAYWEAFDSAGNRISRGIIDPTRSIFPPGAPGGSRLVVRRAWRHQSGLMTSGTLDVSFAVASSDLTAPTVTSLRVTDSAGRTVPHLALGDAATLHVSAGDLDHGKRMEPKPTKTEATKVLYRLAGTVAWNPLALALVDSESGSTNTQRHVPAGDIYRADLRDATRAAGLVDLRVELEDLAGNRVVWTQEGALFVGPPSAAPSRARRVRRP